MPRHRFCLGEGRQLGWRRVVFSDRLLSDHVGLGFRWSPPRSARRSTLPQWVATDPRIPTLVESMLEEAGVAMGADAFARIAGVTACIHRVAKQVVRESRRPPEAVAPEWEAHWISAARTACLRRDRPTLADALARVPSHAHLFDTVAMHIISGAAYVHTLQTLVHGRFVADQRRDPRVATNDFERRAVRKRYSILMSAWSPKLRIITRTVALSAAGDVLRDDSEAVA